MKEMLKLGLVLAAFAGIACVALALVNTATEPVIEKAKAEKIQNGMKSIFADADNFAEAEGFTSTVENGVTIEKVYYAYKNGETAGVVVQAAGSTYDKASLLVGVAKDKILTGIKFLSLSDTPGFGQRALEPEFYEQFAGLSAECSFTPKKDFDGISGATITTTGVSVIVKTASETALKYLAAK